MNQYMYASALLCMCSLTHISANISFSQCAWNTGKSFYVAYMQDMAGYAWTKDHSDPQAYQYNNTSEKSDCSNIRLMTFNIQRAQDEQKVDIWQQRPWFSENRLWRIIDIFYQFTPDIAGLQEMRPSTAQALSAELPHGYAYVESSDINICKTFPNLIVYNTYRFSLQNVQIIPIAPEKFRLIIKAELYDHYMGTSFIVYNIHQDHISKAITRELRDTGYKLLNDDIASIDKPYIVLGDFNVDYTAILENIPHVQPAYTGNMNSWISWDSASADDGMLIDGVFIDKGVPEQAIEKSEVIVAQDEVAEDGTMQHDNRASDHRPIFADLTFDQ